MPAKKFIFGIDIGGTKLALALGDTAGHLYDSVTLDNKGTDFIPMAAQMARHAREMLTKAGSSVEGLAAIGISAPGAIDFNRGILLAPCNNPKWLDVPIVDVLKKDFSCPIYIEHDANGGVLAEWLFGAGRGAEDLIYLTMSTGIGGGIISKGKLVRGAFGQAGEVGHMVLQDGGRLCHCGLFGCWEAYGGGLAVAEEAQRRMKSGKSSNILFFAKEGKIENVDMIAIEKAVRSGDELAAALWDGMCRRNAQGIGILINALNPRKIVLGTIAWAAGDLFMEPLKKFLCSYAWERSINQCEIVPGELRKEMGYYAGVAAALNFMAEEGVIVLPAGR